MLVKMTALPGEDNIWDPDPSTQAESLPHPAHRGGGGSGRRSPQPRSRSTSSRPDGGLRQRFAGGAKRRRCDSKRDSSPSESRFGGGRSAVSSSLSAQRIGVPRAGAASRSDAGAWRINVGAKTRHTSASMVVTTVHEPTPRRRSPAQLPAHKEKIKSHGCACNSALTYSRTPNSANAPMIARSGVSRGMNITNLETLKFAPYTLVGRGHRT